VQGKHFEPSMDAPGDGIPAGLEHHVVAHAGKDLCFGAEGPRGVTDFLLGETHVVLGSQDL
jgi:hypothetical protein